jgi:hypothetical protein
MDVSFSGIMSHMEDLAENLLAKVRTMVLFSSTCCVFFQYLALSTCAWNSDCLCRESAAWRTYATGPTLVVIVVFVGAVAVVVVVVVVVVVWSRRRWWL